MLVFIRHISLSFLLRYNLLQFFSLSLSLSHAPSSSPSLFPSSHTPSMERALCCSTLQLLSCFSSLLFALPPSLSLFLFLSLSFSLSSTGSYPFVSVLLEEKTKQNTRMLPFGSGVKTLLWDPSLLPDPPLLQDPALITDLSIFGFREGHAP